MTITIGWVRRNKDTCELLIASDSRLRSRGSIDESQKIVLLQRGDCCLGFCGDTQIAFPLFFQIASAFNNFLGTRTRAKDITDVTDYIAAIANNFVKSWDLAQADKNEELQSTRIMFAGWSWRHHRFTIKVLGFYGDKFKFNRYTTTLPHPWKERHKSLVVIGDYKTEYMQALELVLEKRHGAFSKIKDEKKVFDFDYEPVQALQNILSNNSKLDLVGGSSQMAKVYSFGNSLPIVIRNQLNEHFLLGRRLFPWERTEYPILDLGANTPKFHYPLEHIPDPHEIV